MNPNISCNHTKPRVLGKRTRADLFRLRLDKPDYFLQIVAFKSVDDFPIDFMTELRLLCEKKPIVKRKGNRKNFRVWLKKNQQIGRRKR